MQPIGELWLSREQREWSDALAGYWVIPSVQKNRKLETRMDQLNSEAIRRLGEHEWLIVAHLTVGTILWCALVVTSLLALRVPARERASAPRVRRALSAAGGEA